MARRGLDGLTLTNTVTMLIRKGLQVGYKTGGEDSTPPHPTLSTVTGLVTVDGDRGRSSDG